ncbi:hypothetical protein SlsnVgp055 [Spodoptera littoralis nucleopolyhedrovirus]|uniref:Chitin-binding type-2 domain-containing protein n=1 Tax=Spodoptera littoralis nuclear polyhedrosis virus TaxID=10456 RepID=M1JTF6_NPVSL|nr:hypothetical protein SlsnVgp055 [Spodoptera littoralis nucleopolyhedrovirus]AGE89910.1 hypothetical protein SlsnVgp055 [Spodoptera littoralis nucleopolyhedrovirus]AYU75245.1 hypothetical protein [Spodoptera littoralis nucleopolyhedrovirus]
MKLLIIAIFFVLILIIIGIIHLVSSASNEKDDTPDDEISFPNCKPGYFGNIQDPVYCDKFYLCSIGSELSFFCVKGFGFDNESKTCQPIEFVDCGDRIVSPR